MTIYGYARVSFDGHTLDDQVKQLRAEGAVTVFREEVSGRSRLDCSQLRKAVDKLATGDMLLVTRLDCLARSVRDLLNIIEEIRQAGAGFRSLADSDLIADPDNPTGRLILSALGSVANFERSHILARISRGRQAALTAGVKFGPKYKLSDYQRREALLRVKQGVESIRAIARSYNVDHSMVSRLAAKDVTLPPAKPALDPVTAKAAQTFLRHIEDRYAPVDMLVFGSRARGTHAPDSDADVAVILKGTRGNRYEVSSDMAGIAFDVMLETGILVDPLPLWEQELRRSASFSNPALIENIKRDGLRI